MKKTVRRLGGGMFRKIKLVQNFSGFLIRFPPNAAATLGLSEQSVSLHRCWGMGDGAIQKLI